MKSGTVHDSAKRERISSKHITIAIARMLTTSEVDLPHTPPPNSQYIQPHSRKFLSLTSCCLCLWRRPAHLATAHAICVATATAYLLSLATASAPGDGPRNLSKLAHLATARTICVATATANFGLWRRPAHLATARSMRIFYLW